MPSGVYPRKKKYNESTPLKGSGKRRSLLFNPISEEVVENIIGKQNSDYDDLRAGMELIQPGEGVAIGPFNTKAECTVAARKINKVSIEVGWAREYGIRTPKGQFKKPYKHVVFRLDDAPPGVRSQFVDAPKTSMVICLVRLHLPSQAEIRRAQLAREEYLSKQRETGDAIHLPGPTNSKTAGIAEGEYQPCGVGIDGGNHTAAIAGD